MPFRRVTNWEFAMALKSPQTYGLDTTPEEHRQMHRLGTHIMRMHDSYSIHRLYRLEGKPERVRQVYGDPHVSDDSWVKAFALLDVLYEKLGKNGHI